MAGAFDTPDAFEPAANFGIKTRQSWLAHSPVGPTSGICPQTAGQFSSVTQRRVYELSPLLFRTVR
jgi:hypothetical protein